MTSATLPRQHLSAAARLYPGAWRAADAMRQQRGRELPAWPEWCYLPMAGWYAIVSADAGVDRLPLHLVGDVARLAALGAWRLGQGIYRFAPDLYACLIDTPITGDLPDEALYRLPEWCVYIETPALSVGGVPLAGFFGHLEWDANTGRPELRLLLDVLDPAGQPGPLLPVPLHLGRGSLRASLDATAAEARRQLVYAGRTARLDEAALPADAAHDLAPLVSLLLYLCADDADFGAARPARPTPVRTKAGWRLFGAERTRVWDVGVRLGAALHRAQTDAAAADACGPHAAPRPHIRRAHWHTYWVGAGRTEARLRWLPPIPVGVTDVDALPAVIHPQEGPK